MSYKAYLKQEGEGCDYSIGCGQKLIDLKSITLKEAMIELIQIISREYMHPEYRLESVFIFEISNTIDMDIKSVYKKIEAFNKEDDNRLKEDAEKAEYERLKIKYD